MKHNRVGLGTFPLAGVFSKISKEEAKDIVRAFLDNGGYYIDTAPLYGFGYVEELLGEVLRKYSREKYFIITKCAYVDVEGKTFQTVQRGVKYGEVLRECERSLKKLGLEYVDLYIVHSPDPVTQFDETMQALVDLQKQGKIKEIGVSNVNLLELKEYNKIGKVSYIQNRFSIINRSIDNKLSGYLKDRNINLIPYNVLERGQLTGRVNEGFHLKDGDMRANLTDWREDRLMLVSEWIKESLGPIAKELGVTIGQLAIAWTLHQPFVGFPIVGVTNTKYLLINMKSNDVVLSKEILDRLDGAYLKLEDQIQSTFHTSVREYRGLNDKYY